MAARVPRKALAILLAALMVLSTLAITAPALAEEPAEELHIGLQPYEEPVTITWAVQSTAVQQFFNGDTYRKQPLDPPDQRKS